MLHTLKLNLEYEMNKIKVVLLDDESTVIELLEMYLHRMKYPEVIATFEDPIAFLREEPNLTFDLLISDVDMPGMNGLELIKLVKKPILFVTGKANAYGNELLEASMEGGNVIGAIPKPVNFSLLEKAIQKVSLIPVVKSPSELYNFKVRNGIAPVRLDKIQCIATIDFSKLPDERDRKAPKGSKWLYRMDGAQIEIIDYTMERLIKDLPPNIFCQISDSEIVNRAFVSVFNKNDVKVRIHLRTNAGGIVEKEEVMGIGDLFKSKFRGFMDS